LAFAAIYLSRVGVVGSVFEAALTQVLTVVMPPAVAAQKIGVGPCRGGRVATCLGDGAHCSFAALSGGGAHCPSQSNGSNREQQKLSLDPSYQVGSLD
jgi:hypothetical protein